MSARWIRRGKIALLAAMAAAAAIVAVFETGLVEQWARSAIVRQLEQKTGARVELGAFHLHTWRLRAELDNLTLHGREAAGSPPLFHADHVQVAIRILSFFGKQIALQELTVVRPEVALRFDAEGHSNLPTPRIGPSRSPWQTTLFHLRIRHLELRDGSASVNDRRVPLALDGRDLNFSLHYEKPPGGEEAYVGAFDWQQVQLAARHDIPFRFDLSAKFTLHRGAFELDELVWKLPHSELNLRAELPSFAEANWKLRYRGRLSLEDLRTILRQPHTPDGVADFSGQAQYASGEWTASGHYSSRDIRMPYQWFHAGGMETWGEYAVEKRRLTVPELRARALGGTMEGRLEMDFQDLAFRTETRLRGASLAAALAAVDNREFPVHTLHWDARVDVDSVNTWDANFKHFRSKGETRWAPPESLASGRIPVTARIDYDYSEDARGVTLSQSEITTPKTAIQMDGLLGATDSALEVKLRAEDLLDWDDFINILRGADAEPRRIAGNVTWRGRVLGPLAGPTFAGHVDARDAHYDALFWNEIGGDLEYSPDDFRLVQAVVRHGQTSAEMDLALTLDGAWSFVPESAWTLDARLTHAATSDLQEIFGTHYAASGFLSGTFRGSGTRSAPRLDTEFVLEPIETKGVRFDRLSGILHLEPDEYRLSRAELRKDSGRMTGEVAYRPQEQEAEFDVSGKGIPLEKFEVLKSATLPVAGELNFHLQGRGPLKAPVAQGDLQLVNLQVGAEMEGNFRGQVASDGHTARITLSSEMTRGSLKAQIEIGLAGDALISGRLAVTEFDLDPFIIAGLHLRQLTGHSSVGGEFTISGALRKPETIAVEADITRASFDYEFVQLQNDGPVRLHYRRNEVNVEQAHLRGPNTDLQVSGSARFDQDRPIHFDLSGKVNLRLLRGVLPELEAQGEAEMNVAVEGTISQPQITGRASVREASAHYADFPAGLSHLKGDFVFDRSRLLFDRVTAESGGGQLTLRGSVNYGEEEVRYEIEATTAAVRIRYPAGVSWLAGGTMQLAGTQKAALLSGRVQVERVLFAEGVDVASFFAAASEPTSAPLPGSPFLRNLAFDIEGDTSPGARIEWGGAHVEMEGSVRLRGTWEHPILLGHIHLIGGEMAFRGNTFDITRGDINFANPFRLDPVLNVEATTTISQYQVTINFSGSASRLSLSYRSDPPLPDSDIVALLALGSTGEESALRSQTAGSQNYGATALLSEAISTGLGGRIERLFGISHFRVDPFLAGTTTESNAAARVTIQQQVTRGLTLTYSTNATGNQQQLIQAEYSVKRNLSVVFLRDINGTYGFDIKFVRHFK